MPSLSNRKFCEDDCAGALFVPPATDGSETPLYACTSAGKLLSLHLSNAAYIFLRLFNSVSTMRTGGCWLFMRGAVYCASSWQSSACNLLHGTSPATSTPYAIFLLTLPPEMASLLYTHDMPFCLPCPTYTDTAVAPASFPTGRLACNLIPPPLLLGGRIKLFSHVCGGRIT